MSAHVAVCNEWEYHELTVGTAVTGLGRINLSARSRSKSQWSGAPRCTQSVVNMATHGTFALRDRLCEDVTRWWLVVVKQLVVVVKHSYSSPEYSCQSILNYWIGVTAFSQTTAARQPGRAQLVPAREHGQLPSGWPTRLPKVGCCCCLLDWRKYR